MKKITIICFALLLCLCFAACASDSTTAQNGTAANGSTANASGDAALDAESTAAAQEAATITVTPSTVSSTLAVTGQIADYFIALTDSYAGDDTINFCVQFETTEGAFADFRWHYSANTNQFFYLKYAAGEMMDLIGSAADGCVTFTYQTGLIDLEAIDFITVYLDEGDGPPSMYTQLPISQIALQGEVAQEIAQDTLGIVGYYTDIYDDYALLTIGTDAFGYTANLNGTLYSLSVNESDGGDYNAYIATAEDGSRFCLNFFEGEHPNMLISEYYGEAEMRYTCEYEPLFSEVFYSYDSDLNQTDSTLQLEFDGTKIRVTLFDTYVTDWLDLAELRYSATTEMLLAGISFAEMPVTNLADGQTYFLTLSGMAHDESWYPEMNIWTYAIFEIYDAGDLGLSQNALVISDTAISDVQTDAASVAKINDIIGVYTSSYEYTIQRADGSVYFESFEITENEIIFNGNVIAQINLDELYGTMMLGGYQVIYDGDTPTHTLHIYVRGDLLDITLQEYGTVFVSSIASPPNNQTPSLDVTVTK